MAQKHGVDDRATLGDCFVLNWKNLLMRVTKWSVRLCSERHTDHSPNPERQQWANQVIAMLNVFFDSKGVVQKELVRQGQIVNVAYYVDVLERLWKRVVRTRKDSRLVITRYKFASFWSYTRSQYCPSLQSSTRLSILLVPSDERSYKTPSMARAGHDVLLEKLCMGSRTVLWRILNVSTNLFNKLLIQNNFILLECTLYLMITYTLHERCIRIRTKNYIK